MQLDCVTFFHVFIEENTNACILLLYNISNDKSIVIENTVVITKHLISEYLGVQ